MNLIKKIKNFWKPEGQENMKAPENQHTGFVLMYKELVIGTLEFTTGGEWIFKYSEPFKNQSNIKPLIDFPTIEKKYQSADLWPFFASRIPSINLPSVQEAVAKQKVDVTNPVEMLTAFGKQTITNPFLLTVR